MSRRTPSTAPRRTGKRPTIPARRSVRRPTNAEGGEQAPVPTGPRPMPEQHAGQLERIAELRAKAFEMRKQGATYRQIAKALGIQVASAYEHVQAELLALRELMLKDAQDVLQLELERLDAILLTAFQQFRGGNVGAGFVLLKAMERRARLLGLDKPVKVAPTTPEGEQAYLHVDLKDLTPEQLAAIERKLEATLHDITRQLEAGR